MARYPHERSFVIAPGSGGDDGARPQAVGGQLLGVQADILRTPPEYRDDRPGGQQQIRPERGHVRSMRPPSRIVRLRTVTLNLVRIFATRIVHNAYRAIARSFERPRSGG